jgi:hypothetical protein
MYRPSTPRLGVVVVPNPSGGYGPSIYNPAVRPSPLNAYPMKSPADCRFQRWIHCLIFCLVTVAPKHFMRLCARLRSTMMTSIPNAHNAGSQAPRANLTVLDLREDQTPWILIGASTSASQQHTGKKKVSRFWNTHRKTTTTIATATATANRTEALDLKIHDY